MGRKRKASKKPVFETRKKSKIQYAKSVSQSASGSSSRPQPVCKSCHMPGHNTGRSKKCANFKYRPGKEPPSNAAAGRVLQPCASIKMGLRSKVKDDAFEMRVQQVVQETTCAAYEASILLLLHFQLICEAKEPFPDSMDPTWLRKYYAAVCGKEVDTALQEAFNVYSNARGTSVPRPGNIPGQILTYQVKEHLRILDLHVRNHFATTSVEWLR